MVQNIKYLQTTFKFGFCPYYILKQILFHPLQPPFKALNHHPLTNVKLAVNHHLNFAHSRILISLGLNYTHPKGESSCFKCRVIFYTFTQDDSTLLSSQSVKLFPFSAGHLQYLYYILLLLSWCHLRLNHQRSLYRIKVNRRVGVTRCSPRVLSSSPPLLLALLNRNCRTLIGLVVNKP